MDLAYNNCWTPTAVLITAHWSSRRGRDWRLLTEMFTMLGRAGASQIITYAAAGVVAALGCGLAAQIAETAQAGFVLPGTLTERMTRCCWYGPVPAGAVFP